MTEVETEIPRCFSMSIQSDVAVFRILLLFTAPATCICPPKSRNFSVNVVLPASGWEMMAKVRLLSISFIVLIVRRRQISILPSCPSDSNRSACR